MVGVSTPFLTKNIQLNSDNNRKIFPGASLQRGSNVSASRKEFRKQRAALEHRVGNAVLEGGAGNAAPEPEAGNAAPKHEAGNAAPEHGAGNATLE